jgi:hypothetical protein
MTRYTVSVPIGLQQGDDANTKVFNQQIDLAVLLSQRLQTNVRQGHVFKVHKLALGLTPNGGDLDTGLSTAGTLQWCPATKNSVKSWQMTFETWRKQKQLTLNAVGQGVRYDDFEVAYSYGYVDSRTSTLLAGGMSDTASEQVCIYGVSTEAQDITLEDIYQSAQEQLPPSRFPIGNAIVKESKYTEVFPDAQTISFGANWSTIIADGVGEPDSGTAYAAAPVYVEDKNTLCGVLLAQGYVLAEDTAGSIEDQLQLFLHITCEISTPLVYRPRRKSSKKLTNGTRSKSTRTSKM